MAQSQQGIEEAEIPLPDDDDDVKMSFLRIQPGRAVLEHTHDGGESDHGVSGRFF